MTGGPWRIQSSPSAREPRDRCLAWCWGWIGGPARFVEIHFIVDEKEETFVLSTHS